VRFAFYDRLPPARRRIYDRSDGIVELPIPTGEDLAPDVAAIIDALAAADLKAVRRGCQKLLDALTDRFVVPPLKARVYAVRPSGDWGELHGMYRPREDGGPPDVELWMRTARLAKVVAPRTFLRTLLHELCHHLDYELFQLPETFHTEGFYKRESHLLRQLAGAPKGAASAPPESP
jgi:hypothetical protein